MNENLTFKLGLLLLRLSGQSVANYGVKNEIILIFSITICLYFLILAILELIINFNINNIPKTFDLVIASYLYLFTLIVFRLNLKTMKKIVNIGDFWPIHYAGDNVRKSQIKIYKFNNKCSIILTFIAAVGVFTSCFTPLFHSKRELPYLLYNWVDQQSSPYYELTYLLSCVYVSGLVFCINGFEFALYGSLSVIYCQMMMLNTIIKQVDIENIETPEDEEDCFRKLIQYVEHYSKILKYFKNINKAFALFILNQAIVIIFTCSMQLFVIVMINDKNVIIKTSFMFASYLGHLFVQCAAVTSVSDQIQSLSTSVYECNWMNIPSLRLKIALLLLMLRAQKGYNFTAGGMIRITMNTFSSILKTMYSFFTLLKTMQHY